MNRQTIKEIGTINLENVEVCNGQIEMHVPVDVVSQQINNVLEVCEKRFIEKHPEVERVYFDIRIIFSFGYDNPDFSLEIYAFNESQEICEIYEEFPIELSGISAKEIKRLTWEKLGEAILGL